ncbi:MAG: flippase [Nanoarchaeota archaeon]|nr:flippase [Nanoarchaeota archaeon]
MKDTDIALKKIAKGAGIFAIGLLISKALAYAYRIIIARMGIEQYGLLSIALAVFGIFITISLLGMSEGIIRFVSFYKGKADQRRIKGVITSALKITLPLSLVGAAFLFFASNWIAVTFFHNSDLSILFKVLAFGIPLDILRSIFFSSIKAFQKVEYEVYGKSIAENITKVVLTLIMVYLGFGVLGAALAYLASIFVSFILSFYFLEKKVFPIVSTKIVSIKNYKPLLVYSLPLLLTGFVFLIIQWTDTLMLGSLRTVFEVGLYNAALPTALLLYIFPSAIRTLFFPVLSELYAQDKRDTFKSVYRTVVKWIMTVNSIIFIFLIIFSYQIIRILFGESYVNDKILFLGVTLPISVLALIILALGLFLGSFFVPSKDTLLVLKKTKLIFFNTAIGAFFNIALNYFLIPPHGIIGAAIATGISFLMIDILMGIESYYITNINPFKSSCMKIAFVALLTFSVMFLFKFYLISNIFYLVTISLVFLVFYFVLLWMIKAFDKEDSMIIRGILDKLKLKN